MFESWMSREIFHQEGVKFAFVTCGDWDLAKMSVVLHICLYI